MRRYVVNRSRREKHEVGTLQVCIIYPSNMNKKQVEKDNFPYSKTMGVLVGDKNDKWRYEDVE